MERMFFQIFPSVNKVSHDFCLSYIITDIQTKWN